MSKLTLTESTAPGTPAANKVVLYAKADGRLYFKADDGNEVAVRSIAAGDLLADGTTPLTANWDVGPFKIIALQLESDVTTGTAPFVVASTTMVANLNAALLGGTSLAGIQTLIDNAVIGLVDHKGGYNASTNTPDLDTAPSGIKKGDAYVVTAAGTFFAVALEIGDWIYANQDNPTTAAHWTIVQGNVDNAILDADYAGTVGLQHKDSAGTYRIIKSNLASATNPTVTDDAAAGYAIYSVWVNTTANPRKIFFCVDTTNGAAVWKEVGTGGVSAKFKSTNYTLIAGDIVGAGSDTGALTMTLPASPSADTYCAIWDSDDNAAVNNIIVARNGSTIDGNATDYTININGGRVDLIYSGSTWKVAYTTPGGGLNQTQVDARVVAVTSGVQSWFLNCNVDLIRNAANQPTVSSEQSMSSGNYWAKDTFVFSASAQQEVSWVTVMPLRYNLGTFRFRYIWRPSDTNTGVVRWVVYPMAATAGDNEAASDTLGTPQIVDDSGTGIANKILFSSWTAAVTHGGASNNELFCFLFLRQAAVAEDTFTGTAQLIGIQVEWTSDQPTDA